MNKSILLTGASGFVGKHYLQHFGDKQNIITVSLRRTAVEDIDFGGVDAVVHLAGKAHQTKKIPSEIYFDINRDLTLRLAQKAKSEGVNQFVFISTVKVYGDYQDQDIKINEKSPCSPSDPYGKSKLEAEEALKEMESEGFLVTIIRPPLVYGKGVKGNLDRLIRLVEKLPILPFDCIDNQRSMVNVLNLLELINFTIQNQTSGVFIAGDKKPHSTTELVKLINKYLKSDKILICLPRYIVAIVSLIKPALINRLFSSYIIDNTITNQKLGFQPPYTFEEGIKAMVEGYKK